MIEKYWNGRLTDKRFAELMGEGPGAAILLPAFSLRSLGGKRLRGLLPSHVI